MTDIASGNVESRAMPASRVDGVFAPQKKKYAKLRQLLAAGFFFSGIAPILVMALASTSSVKQLSLKEAAFRAEQIVRHRHDVVNIYLDNQLRFFSTFLHLQPLDALNLDQTLQTLQQGFAGTEVVALQLRRATDGSLIQNIQAGPEPFHADTSTLFDLAENAKAGEAISDLFTDSSGRPCFALAVSDERNNLIVRVILRADSLNALLRGALVFPDDAVFLYNTASNATSPLISAGERLSSRDAFPQSAAMPLFTAESDDALWRSTDRLYAAQKLKTAPWVLLFSTSVRDYLGGYLSYRNGILAIVVCTALLFLLFSIGISRLIVSRIRRGDQEQSIQDQQLADMNKMAGIGKLAAGVAHEINNPLQLIQMQAGWMESLLKEESPEVLKHREEYFNSLGKIHEHIKRAGTITRRLLGYSRKVDDERDADINALLQKTVSFVESDAYKHNVQLHLHLDPALPVVRTDTSQLQQILLNLIENAMDAVSSGGHIDMYTTVVDDELQVRICDDGPGIAADLFDKIWQPFFTTKEEGKGTGLGLAICRNIARKLGGGISATNRAEGGAVFTLHLPLKPARKTTEITSTKKNNIRKRSV